MSIAIPTYLNRVISARVATAAGSQIPFLHQIPVDPVRELNNFADTVRCLIVEAMKEYVILSGKRLREAKKIHVTPILETLLRQDFIENKIPGLGTHEKPERCDQIMGMKPVWGAAKFKLSA